MAPAAPQAVVGRVSRSHGKSHPSHPGECCCGSRCASGRVPAGTDLLMFLLKLRSCSCQGASFSLLHPQRSFWRRCFVLVLPSHGNRGTLGLGSWRSPAAGSSCCPSSPGTELCPSAWLRAFAGRNRLQSSAFSCP